MGIGLYVDGERVAGWSYSGFNDFRRRLAKEIGIDNLQDMEGFGNNEWIHHLWENPEKAEKLRQEDLARPRRAWSEINDAIVPFLHHSDCDGELTAEECRQIAPRLRELVSRWGDSNTINVNPEFREKYPQYPATMVLDDYDKTNGLALAAGMEKAAELGVSLDFC